MYMVRQLIRESLSAGKAYSKSWRTGGRIRDSGTLFELATSRSKILREFLSRGSSFQIQYLITYNSMATESIFQQARGLFGHDKHV